MSTTMTRTGTYTSTLSRVVYVTRKVQADLFAIVDTYHQIRENYAADLVHDLRIFLDEEVVDRIEFLWVWPGTNVVTGAYSYRVIANGIGLVDDRSGGVGYDQMLAQSKFDVRVYYNERWFGMPQHERQAISDRLAMPWGPGGQLDFSRGNWKTDRTYAKDNYGLARQSFTRW
jgi:hypothetical protein